MRGVGANEFLLILSGGGVDINGGAGEQNGGVGQNGGFYMKVKRTAQSFTG